MLINRNQMVSEEKVKLRGGEGTLTMTHLAPPETLRNATLMAELRIPPECSIGLHKHEGETEFYIIVSGSGTLNDNGKESTVRSGDVVITGNGSSHGIKNTGKKDIVLHAIILKY